MDEVHADIDFNEVYLPLLENKDRFIFLYGGRNSGKSIFAAQKMIIRCLNEKYFRCILVRKTYESIKDSQFQTLKDLIYDYGLDHLFTFNESPLRIRCLINSNSFLARGLDKPEKIKSVKDPSCVWYEEGNQIDEKDFIITSTSVRSAKAEYLQEVFSFNPETECNYQEFWLYKMFFAGHSEKSFRDKVTMKLPSGTEFSFNYTVLHTTYTDNEFVTEQQMADLEQWKEINPYYYTVYTLGLWGNKEVTDMYWKNFSFLKHVDKVNIDLDLPLHISFDENVNPYPALSIWQVDGQHIKQVHEICLRSPKNKLTEVSKEFVRWAKGHDFENIVYIYGDATSSKEDAKLERGYNYFSLFKKYIEPFFKVRIQRPSKNPPIALRAEYINTIYAYEYDGWSITIGDTCKESINDYLLVQERSDGAMIKPKKNGIELQGHFSDTKCYFCCELTRKSFHKFRTGQKSVSNFKFYGTTRKYY